MENGTENYNEVVPDRLYCGGSGRAAMKESTGLLHEYGGIISFGRMGISLS